MEDPVPLTLDAVVAWMRSLPQTTTFTAFHSRGCPVGAYLRAHGFPEARALELVWTPYGHTISPWILYTDDRLVAAIRDFDVSNRSPEVPHGVVARDDALAVFEKYL
jgi:hypothetical protein